MEEVCALFWAIFVGPYMIASIYFLISVVLEEKEEFLSVFNDYLRIRVKRKRGQRRKQSKQRKNAFTVVGGIDNCINKGNSPLSCLLSLSRT
jgi:hypothetical protein